MVYCGCDENRRFHLDKNAGSHSELRIEAQLIAAFPKCQQSLVFAEQIATIPTKKARPPPNPAIVR